LEFKDESGQTLLTGEHLVEAKAGANPSGDGSFVVNLEFDKAGADLFKQATTANLNKPLVIVLDNEQISAPRVNTVIADGKCYIESFDATTANQLAVQLRSGALPVSLTLMEKRTVGPKLGADSLDSSVKAGLIGIIAILVFMLGYYRLPGLVADISMVLYSIIVLGTMAILGSVLTLPGIAGFVLSIGMAVDANVIIYERIKEELRLGKTIHAGIDAGFKRAFWTVFDANLTTLFTALILMYFGTGAVKGFAVTLTIGLVASMLVALTFTRYMLVLFAHVTDNKKLFGV
jgi:protein-export membrane protein SecD